MPTPIQQQKKLETKKIDSIREEKDMLDMSHITTSSNKQKAVVPFYILSFVERKGTGKNKITRTSSSRYREKTAVHAYYSRSEEEGVAKAEGND